MNLTLDLGSLSLIESPNDRRKVARIDVKRGDEWPVTLRFYNGTTPVRLPADTEIIFAAKENGKYDTTPVVFCPATDWTASEIPVDPANDIDPHYTALVNLNSIGLAELLGLDETSANDIKSVDLMAEITWQDTTATLPTTSATFILRVANDVWRGDEPTPLPLPTPDEWLGARAVRYDEEQDLTPEQQSQARANIDAASLDALAEKMAQAILLTEEQPLPIYPLSVTVEGILTDGANPVVFPELFYNGFTAGRTAYEADGYQLYFDFNAWILANPMFTAEWESYVLVETVDLLTDPFGPVGSATGEATIVAHSLEAEAVGQLCRHGDAAPYRWFVAETAGPGTVWREVFVEVDTSNFVGSTDPRLENAREWTATTVTQAEAETGTATTRRAWTAQRVRQAIVAWYGTLSAAFRNVVASPSSDNFRAWVTDETGTGSMVFADSPTLITPTINQINTSSQTLLTGVGTAGLLQLRATATNGFASIDLQDFNGVQRGGIGYGNPSSPAYIDQVYFYATGKRLCFGSTVGATHMVIGLSGGVTIGALTDAGANNLLVHGSIATNGNVIRVSMARTPASATAAGTTGMICWDADYIYVCTATNTWKRTALSTW